MHFTLPLFIVLMLFMRISTGSLFELRGKKKIRKFFREISRRIYRNQRKKSRANLFLNSSLFSSCNCECNLMEYCWQRAHIHLKCVCDARASSVNFKIFALNSVNLFNDNVYMHSTRPLFIVLMIFMRISMRVLQHMLRYLSVNLDTALAMRVYHNLSLFQGYGYFLIFLLYG